MRHTIAIAAALGLLAAAAPLAAQEAAASAVSPRSVLARTSASTTPALCTYATCAIRVESGWLRGPQLVRGIEGARVANLDHPRDGELAHLFAGNDSATAYASDYVRAANTNWILTLGGIVFGAVGLAQENRMNGFTAAGAAMLVVSIPFQHAEQVALSRAVWWYNASLPAVAPDR